MHFTQAMRQPRRDTPLFSLTVLLLMCCASGCIAVAPATQYRCGFDVKRKSGPLSTAVVREVLCKGQDEMQAYTFATQDDNSGWEPIRMVVSTEDLERGTNKRKKYCEEGEDECYNALGQKVSCKAGHVLTEEKKQLYTRKILPGAVKLHTERLLVKPTGGTITVPRAMNGPCSHFTVPTRHKSDGVLNADFIIYAAARPSGTDGRAVWPATCNTLKDFRPNIDAMNFYPK
ncbi:surface protease GP63 [Trypanosoma cruzi]|nr:surface protease GP63 [Trypanosoma cruzi]